MDEFLPVEMWEEVAFYLSFRDLVSLSQTNRRFRWIVNVACPRVWWFKRPDGWFWPRMRSRNVSDFEDRRANSARKHILRLLRQHPSNIHLPNRSHYIDCAMLS